jgi:MFS family permease
MMLYFVGDTIMGYTSPVVIHQYLSSSVLMGFVLGFSSLIGFFSDLFLPQFFPGKTFFFFSPLTLIIALFFPLAFLAFPHGIPTFLFAMLIWGLYYELARFSHYSFIHTILKPAEHAFAWGTLQAFQSLSLLITPLVAMTLIDIHISLPFLTAMSVFIAGLAGVLVLVSFLKQKQLSTIVPAQHHRLKQEIRIWKVLFVRVWPIYLFLLTMTLVDSAFWTLGALLTERLRHLSWFGSLLIPAYILPFLFMSLLAPWLAKPWGKKRIAFATAFIGSLLLMGGGILTQGLAFIPVVFVSSLFLSISYPEIYAVFEDYVGKLNEFGNDMVGLESSAISLGYIFGPVLGGVLAAWLGIQGAIVIFASTFALTALIALLVVPRRVSMPKQKLQAVLEPTS